METSRDIDRPWPARMRRSLNPPLDFLWAFSGSSEMERLRLSVRSTALATCDKKSCNSTRPLPRPPVAEEKNLKQYASPIAGGLVVRVCTSQGQRIRTFPTRTVLNYTTGERNNGPPDTIRTGHMWDSRCFKLPHTDIGSACLKCFHRLPVAPKKGRTVCLDATTRSRGSMSK